MKKTFTLSPSRAFPKYWFSAPNISTLYSPKTLKSAHFIFMKAPMNKKMLENLNPEYNWTCETALQCINAVAPPDCQIFAINLSKKNNAVSTNDWVPLGVNYEENRISWSNPKPSIEKILSLAHKPPNSRPVVLALYSGTGFNKTIFACACAVCAENFSKLPEVIANLSAIHPPGLLNQRAVDGFYTYFQQQIPFQLNIKPPKWYAPLNNLNKKNPPLVTITSPGLQEIGATPGNRNDALAIKKILVECDWQLPAPIPTATQNRIIWSEQMIGYLEKEPHRVTFMPEGVDVMLIMFEKFSGFILDSNGDIWNIPVRTKSDIPLVLMGTLQKQNDGNFIFFATDIMKCGELVFREDTYDTRISFIWNFVIAGLSSKPNPPTIQFVMRSFSLIKNSLKTLHLISMQSFKCCGVSFVPENMPPGSSLLLPYGECLVPFQAVANSSDTLILCAIDDQTGEYTPVAVTKVGPNVIYADGFTVYADYSSQTKSWVIKKYSREIRTVLASFALAIARYRELDPYQPEEVLKIVQERCKKQDDYQEPQF